MKNIKIRSLILPVLCFLMIIGSMTDVFAAVTPGASIQNPIGYGTVDSLLSNVLTTVQGIVAILAVTMIVIGGIIYITSAGDPGRVQLAKTAVTAALIGLAIAVAAPTFLREIYNILGSTSTPAAAAGSKSLSQILQKTLEVLLSIIGTLSVLMLVIGGVMYMTSGGDSTRTDTAKNTIKFAITGLVVAILSLVIVKTIVGLF